jgi:outer membrane protein OmpU
MKNVLLATTAIALTAGYAAADVSYSASAKLAYGNFGTGDFTSGGSATAAKSYSYSNEFDFTITGSGEAGGVAYSASMTLDEGGADDTGAFSMSTNGFTYAYDANDFGGLVDSGADGEDDDAGDWMLSYAGNGFTASYEVDEDDDGRYELLLGYSANGLSVGMEASDDDGSDGTTVAGVTTNADTVNTVSLGYTMGALAIAYSADDQATQNYDVSATYTMGATSVTAATDENEQHSIGVSTTVGPVVITARTEQDIATGKTGAGTGAENEFGLTYTSGALSIGYKKDTGDAGDFGDEAETVTTITYDLGGITLVAKGTDQDETEVSAAFSF